MSQQKTRSRGSEKFNTLNLSEQVQQGRHIETDDQFAKRKVKPAKHALPAKRIITVNNDNDGMNNIVIVRRGSDDEIGLALL